MIANLSALVVGMAVGLAGPSVDDPFGALQLPAAVVRSFWDEPSARKLLEMPPRAVADLVPTQAGLRFCRCPACGADEREEPLAWSLEQLAALKCRRCAVVVPNDQFPAKPKDKDKVPEETVEVLPGVTHHYPYHAVDENAARYPDERLFLRARIDYEVRRYLTRFALFAAVRARGGGPDAADPRLESLACVILLRFAQVYPAYAIHHDQPGRPKTLQPARLLPPYRRGFQTAKWEWTGSQEVPLHLVMAYSLLRGSPAWDGAGKLLNDPAPRRTVERELFRAMAEFARHQPLEITTEGLYSARGLLAVARLLGDRELGATSRRQFEEFSRSGFYHDGFWREAEAGAHRRVLDLLHGWVAAELGASDSASSPVSVARGGAGEVFPILPLARRVESALGPRAHDADVRRASWPPRPFVGAPRGPILFGGAGIARLVLGDGAGALEFEVLGQDSYVRSRFQRLALRLSLGGRPVLDDLDERASTGTGWELATPSHNVVVVDGLNQRETPTLAGQPAAGSNLLFYAAEPDFQVVSMGDPRAYPQSTTRYRQAIVLTGGPRARYALGVFEVHGGLQHDQIFHAASRGLGTWSLSEPQEPAPPSLLPSTIRFLPSAPVEQGRWFVQAYGEFHPEGRALIERPALAQLGKERAGAGRVAAASTRVATDPASPSVRLHLLGDTPSTAFTVFSPDPPFQPGEGRSGLIVRRRSGQGETLRSTFVTLFEPVGPAFPPLRRVGRVESPPNVVVVLIETDEGSEYLMVNLEPGSIRRVQLPNGRFVSFDGLALRVREHALALAGGTFAEGSGKLASSSLVAGTITGVVRNRSHRGPGWFVTPSALDPNLELAGHTLIIEHGDGTRRSWTLDSVEPIPDGARLHVREEPGFVIDSGDGSARYELFPRVTAPGPHRFSISRIAR